MENTHSVSKDVMEKIEAHALEVMASYSGCHDHLHIQRVLANARLIINQTSECVDVSVVELVCLLHDVGDAKLINTKTDDHTIAQKILDKYSVPSKVTDHVIQIIENLSYRGGNNQALETIEGQIAQDADRLDAIGAIGIARCFAYGGSKNRMLWNPNNMPKEFATKEEYLANNGDSLSHFYEKLFKLKDLMNTEAGKAIAEERDAFMHQFVDQFKREFLGQ